MLLSDNNLNCSTKITNIFENVFKLMVIVYANDAYAFNGKKLIN